MTLKLNNTSKTFPDGTKALLPTELTVKTGEIVSLLGPSGCGKTTLLRIIAGLETSNEGSEIWFDDDNVTTLPVERRKVGMVFQSYALFPNMSVRANIGYGLKIQKLSKLEINSRVNEVLEMCQLQDFSARAVSQLSGGQRQRLAIARAIYLDPPILILDEATSSLDTLSEQKVREAIESLHGKRTVIVIAHSLATVAGSDHIYVIENGRLTEQGSHEELRARGGLYSRLCAGQALE